MSPHPILYLHNRDQIAGAEKSLLALIRGMDRRFFLPSFVLPSDGEFAQAVREAGASVAFCPFPPLRTVRWDHLFKTIEALGRIVSRLNPHLLHGNTPRTNLYAGWVGRRRAIPVVWHARNLIYGKMVDVERVFSFLPQRIVCNSEAIRDRFRGLKGFEDRVVTIYSGVDLSEFRPGLDEGGIRREFGVGEAPLVALVARLGIGKGHETFVQAAQSVARRFPNARFLVVGRAEDKEDQERVIFLKKLVERFGLASQVIFTGYRRDMPFLMAALTLLVVATEAEPFGRVILEAMASAKPVVGTATGGTPELIREGETGFLVPPMDPEALAEAIVRLLRNPGEAKRMGENGRRRVEAEFSLEAHAAKIQALYHSLLSS